MARSTDLTGDDLDDLLAEEKHLLKEDRVYVILELDERGDDLFSMFCMDTTTVSYTHLTLPTILRV